MRGEGKGPIFSGVPEAVSLTMGLGSGHHMTLPPNPFLPSLLLEEASPVLPRPWSGAQMLWLCIWARL